MQKGQTDSDNKTEERKKRRYKNRRKEVLAYPHRRNGREYDQAGNQQGSHHAHSEHNGNGGKKCQNHIVKTRIGTAGLRKTLIKSNRKNPRIKHNI